MRLLFGFLLISAPLSAEPDAPTPATPGGSPSDTAPAASEAPAAADVVEVVVVGTTEELDALRGVIGPRDFAGAEARFLRQNRLERAELLEPRQASNVRVRCFVRIVAGRAELLFANRTAERFLVREVDLPNGLDAAGREAVGQVLSLAVTSLIEDEQVGLTRKETERLLGVTPVEAPPEPAPAPPPRVLPPVWSSSLGAAPYYAAKLYSSEVPLVHGPGLRVGWVSTREHSLRSFFVSIGYEVPERYRADQVGLVWETVTFRGGFELLEGLSDLPLQLGGRIGAGIDVIRFAPKGGTTAAEVELTPARTASLPVLTAVAEAGFSITSHVAFGLEIFLDAYPVGLDYTIQESTGATDVFSPYRLRPGASFYVAVR